MCVTIQKKLIKLATIINLIILIILKIILLSNVLFLIINI